MVTFGYVKANVLANEYILRQDMTNEISTTKIKADLTKDTSFEIDRKKVNVLNNAFKISNIGILEVDEEKLEQNKENTWITVSNGNFKKQSNAIIADYNSRTNLINNIVNLAVKYNINGINIYFEDIENVQNLKRFLIELSPRLREVGINSNLILTTNLNEADYAGIVDYIIEK